MKETQEWLTPADIKNYLGVTTRQLRVLVGRYGLPFVNFTVGVEGAHRRFLKTDVDQWIKDNPLIKAHYDGTLEETYGYVHQEKFAEQLRVNVARLIEWRKEGCPTLSVGNKVYYQTEEVAEWLKERDDGSTS